MNRNKLITILFCIVIPLISNAENKKDISTPYGSSQYYVWPKLKDLEEFKVAFDFNFNDPKGTERALYPVSYSKPSRNMAQFHLSPI